MRTYLSLWHGVQPWPEARPTMCAILSAVSADWFVNEAAIRGQGRDRRTILPRRDFMRRAHEAGFSLPQIGEFIGRHHTTVLSGIRSYQRHLGVWNASVVACTPPAVRAKVAA